MEQIKISVRNLVEFILCFGDIDNRYGKAAQKEAMKEGSRIRRKIQRRMGADYQPEVPLKIELEREDYTLLVEGRADGVIVRDGQTTIDEIKGVYQDVRLLEQPILVHLAQAKCYAYILAQKEGLPEVSVQMTYCNIDTEEIKRFREHYTFEEISQDCRLHLRGGEGKEGELHCFFPILSDDGGRPGMLSAKGGHPRGDGLHLQGGRHGRVAEGRILRKFFGGQG